MNVNDDLGVTVAEETTVFEAEVTEDTLPNGWRGPIAGLDIATGDGRMLGTPETGVRTRAYPLILTEQHVGDGTDIPVGLIDRVWSEDGLLHGEGSFDLGSERGAEMARRAKVAGELQVSIHPDDVTAVYGQIQEDGSLKIVETEEDYNSELEGVIVFTDWRLAGLAVVSVPAYTEARIKPVYDYEPSPAGKTDAIVAAVGGQIFRPEFFKNPKLSGPTKLNVDENGRVTGHVALWNSCYQLGGGQNAYATCTKPPRSATGYSRFLVHDANLGNGERIRCGVLTCQDGHTSSNGVIATQKAYANIATQVAKVTCGEDKYGIWVSGEVLDKVRDVATDIFNSPLSGHWEPDADAAHNLEMIAAHIVNTPGFAVRPLVASFDDGVNISHLELAFRMPEVTETDAIDAIAEAVVAKMDARRADDHKAAMAMIFEVGQKSRREALANRILTDARLSRAAELNRRLAQ